MDKTKVWIVGKGPSLDTVNWSKCDCQVVAINEAIYQVPCVLDPIAIAMDKRILKKYKKDLWPTQMVWLPENYTDVQFVRQYRWTRKHITVEQGTLTAAIQIVLYLGVKKIHFVGCDSYDSDIIQYADSIVKRGAEGQNMDGFATINYWVKYLIDTYNIQATWEHFDV